MRQAAGPRYPSFEPSVPRPLLRLLLIVLLLLPGLWPAAASAAPAGHAHGCVQATPAAGGPWATVSAVSGMRHDPGACPDAADAGRCCDGCPVMPCASVTVAAPAVPVASGVPYRLPEDPAHVSGPPRRPPR